jgi:hypothetical protein
MPYKIRVEVCRQFWSGQSPQHFDEQKAREQTALLQIGSQTLGSCDHAHFSELPSLAQKATHAPPAPQSEFVLDPDCQLPWM